MTNLAVDKSGELNYIFVRLMSDQGFEELSIWQDVLDEVVNGRLEGHKCPKCNVGVLDCKFDGYQVDLSCSNCGAWFKGQVA